MTEWTRICLLCAQRGRKVKLESGHCCAPCADRITQDLRDIPKLAEMAAACLTPRQGTGGSTSTAYGPRPPINLDAVDPALAHVPGHDAPLLVILEEWERMVRDQRGYAPYGVASVSRTVVAARNSTGAIDTTTVTLRGVCAFLASQVEWAVSEPGFPLDDYASEIHACMKAVRRWDTARDDLGTMVRCPTLTEQPVLDNNEEPLIGVNGHVVMKECGYRLHYLDWNEHVTCRRCGVTRNASTLATVAMSDGREVWLDPEAAAQWLGVTEGTLRQWARKGRIHRDHGRYRITTERMMA